eukprot:9497107-Pyramimonas_sp.AAC.1
MRASHWRVSIIGGLGPPARCGRPCFTLTSTLPPAVRWWPQRTRRAPSVRAAWRDGSSAGGWGRTTRSGTAAPCGTRSYPPAAPPGWCSPRVPSAVSYGRLRSLSISAPTCTRCRWGITEIMLILLGVYGSSCASNGKRAHNTLESQKKYYIQPCVGPGGTRQLPHVHGGI